MASWQSLSGAAEIWSWLALAACFPFRWFMRTLSFQYVRYRDLRHLAEIQKPSPDCQADEGRQARYQSDRTACPQHGTKGATQHWRHLPSGVMLAGITALRVAG